MPTLGSVAPCFPVSDIGKTIRWYQEYLGFTGYPFPEHEPYVFGIMARDNIEIMLQRTPAYAKPDLYSTRPGGVWDAYIRMKGVKEFYDEIREKVEILMPLKKQPYGDWEFEVRDLNSYVLVFSELVSADK
jgi:uncharacterized glyoxalase superfamily protein PhnB